MIHPSFFSLYVVVLYIYIYTQSMVKDLYENVYGAYGKSSYLRSAPSAPPPLMHKGSEKYLNRLGLQRKLFEIKPDQFIPKHFLNRSIQSKKPRVFFFPFVFILLTHAIFPLVPYLFYLFCFVLFVCLFVSFFF